MELTKKLIIASELRKLAQEMVENKESRLLEDGSSTKEKPFLKMPNDKPPRRKSNNVTDTREYRNQYQKEYREENGNGYIPKGPKKSKEGQDG